MSGQPPKRKLIEVSLPLEAINRASVREKSIRHGHPSTLHLWWSRKPLATARAVLFAQLVDDPSSHPDRYGTEEAQAAERERLHRLIERLVVWENADDDSLLAEAYEEIRSSCGDDPPALLDPFAGGGSIPLEAQRLGLETRASDLNPVAVITSRALVEIPSRLGGRPPVYPGLADTEIAGWRGAEGLSADVRAYGEWMWEEAARRIGDRYPRAILPDGSSAEAIAWIWARTVTCPNPACGIEMPLTNKWWLGRKSGRETYVVTDVVDDSTHPSGSRVKFRIQHRAAGASPPPTQGTVDRHGARCVACGTVAQLDYLRREGRAGGLGVSLMATVAKGQRKRIYLEATDEQERAARVERPELIMGKLAANPRHMAAPLYGMAEWQDLFTDRQLTALTTLSDLVGEARERIVVDALASGMKSGERLVAGGTDAEAYADAIGTYLGMTVSRLADLGNSLCSWEPYAECPRHLFARQAIPMAWDFGEGNPLSESSGSWKVLLEGASRAFRSPAFLQESKRTPVINQADAAIAVSEVASMISTDPPYYDNIPYSDLSDFFYVWLRRSLKGVHPELLETMLAPKAKELVADPIRHEGKDGARGFFERGFREIFTRARSGVQSDFPITVYYAFKQSDVDHEGEASTGWETMLDGMIGSGWEITATWPVRSEAGNRMRSQGSNVLASSIVLALRPRPENAATADRRELIEALRAELPGRLRQLQLGQIAPVDLPQAAIGPGMAVFSRYASVIEADGSPMKVRAALARINEILDEVLNEQEGDFDTTTRFALGWYREHGFEKGEFGTANTIANARNTSVEEMDRAGVLRAVGGKVQLFAPGDLDPGYDPTTDQRISAWEVLQHVIAALDREDGGVGAAGALLASASARSENPVDADSVKELAYLLYREAEKSGRTQDALAFNDIVTAWPDILEAARAGAGQETQTTLDL